MSYVVVFLATRWGSELGGLNEFNTGLALGMAEVLPRGSRCICYVDQLSENPTPPTKNVEVLVCPDDISILVNDIKKICEDPKLDSLHGLLIVGHDIKTGPKAVNCAVALQALPLIGPVASAVVSHMDYVQYGHRKGHALSESFSRMKQQEMVLASADYAFAVGPLLQASFQSARNLGKSPIKHLIPGTPEIQIQHNSRSAMWFFISGRLNVADDQIKNSALVLEALERFYSSRPQGPTSLSIRGKLFAFGMEGGKSDGVFGQLQGRLAEYLDIHAVPFTDRKDEIYQHLASCHVALMPSWHEGFGLSGWEALCAGVPLICSRQSGLAILLDELRQQLPWLSLDSVEFVNPVGVSGDDGTKMRDVQSLTNAIELITQNLNVRKDAAVDLAKTLRREFKWKDTATAIFEHIGWPLASSVSWKSRQKSSQQTSASPDQTKSSAHINDVLERLHSLDIDRDWEILCSAFNYFSDIGKDAQPAARKNLLEKLCRIGAKLTCELVTPEVGRNAESISLRDSGRIDTCWRYMAACASTARNFAEFAELFDEPLRKLICDERFLRREILFYASRFSNQFEESAYDEATRFFRYHCESLKNDSYLQVRLARLTAEFPGWSYVIPSDQDHIAFIEEMARCHQVHLYGFDLNAFIPSQPNLASTSLALSSLRRCPSRQPNEQALGFFNENQPQPVRFSWRSDKRLAAAILSSALGTSDIVKVLECMATDEDESVRWAALDLAFSPTLRKRLHAAKAAKALSGSKSVNEQLGHVVDLAVLHDNGHPWLNREFLLHYLQEQTTRNNSEDTPRLTVCDFPRARGLIGPIIDQACKSLEGSQHPEVRSARLDLKSKVKRVLFVLPPLDFPEPSNSSQASHSSTPPLGLGMLASHVGTLGHDVQICDCHRFPDLCDWLKNHSSSFELIGFNTVLPTVRPTIELLKSIRRRAFRTILVVGGPAAKLGAWEFSMNSGEEKECWDFAISGEAIQNVSLLIEALDQKDSWPSSLTLNANAISPLLLHREIRESGASVNDSLQAKQDWTKVAIDRRHFIGPSGYYEPSSTRSRTKHILEAHVVMSQGCDWNCAFCTERSSLSGGEVRRPVDMVLAELKQLVELHPNLHVQFIDDNFLPQIAQHPTEVKRATSIKWASDLLSGLTQLRRSTTGWFGWRAIFRLEDFFAYEQYLQNDFVRQLSESGCTMLAFGIETGDDDHRKLIKLGAEVVGANKIKLLFERLQAAGIHSKAYFMLGGKSETPESAQKTISFAVDSGASLAYFALYKEFVPAAKALKQQRSSGSETPTAWLDYRQLAIVWDDAFDTIKDSGPKTLRLKYPVTGEEREVYSQLSELGFSFRDLVKYNDYHSETGPSLQVLHKVTWNDPETYFSIVEQAYRNFYLRPEFVSSYKRLLNSGY